MAVIPEGFAQITMFFTGAAVPTGAACTFGVENVTSINAATMASNVSDLIGDSDLMSRLSTACTLSTVRAKLGPNDVGPQADFAADQAGESAGDSSPNIAALIVKNTPAGGRRNKGRMYWPAIIEADVAQGGQLTSGALASFQTHFDAFLGFLEGADLQMHVLHNDEAFSPTVVDNLQVQATLATQRRRLRR